jgi:hypothetical protein
MSISPSLVDNRSSAVSGIVCAAHIASLRRAYLTEFGTENRVIRVPQNSYAGGAANDRVPV